MNEPHHRDAGLDDLIASITAEAHGTFERFTERARHAAIASYNEAMRRKHDRVLPQHIILGLLHEDEGVAARAIVALGWPLAEARDRVAADLPKPGPAAELDSISFSPPARAALGLSLHAALRLGHRYIGTEHILLGLLDQDDQTLAAMGIGRERAEQWILAAIALD